MPEGSEVRTMARDLDNYLFGTARVSARLERISCLSGRYAKEGRGFNLAMGEAIHVRATEVKAKGKFLWFHGGLNYHLCFTMGMTGHFSMLHCPYARLKFEFDSGKFFYFVDKRNFGTARILDDYHLRVKVAQLGLDPLADALMPRDLAAPICDHPNYTLAEFLMDQRIVAGIGNYGKCEILYKAKLSPYRFVGTLGPDEISSLTAAINEVLQESFRCNGASLKDYTLISGLRGTYQDQFKVYRKKTSPEGFRVDKAKTKDGRSTYWVPLVQL